MIITKKELDSALNELKKNAIDNLSIMGFIENNPITGIKRAGNSLLIKGKSDWDWYYISSNDILEFELLISQIKSNLESKYFGSLKEWMIPIISELGEVDWLLSTNNYYLPDTAVLPPNKMNVDNLRNEDAPFILKQSDYKEFLSVKYLTDRIENSISAAIYENDELAAWGLTHDDGALGSIHVLEKYRNKGFGKEIVISLAKQYRQMKKIPFAQIERKNTVSINLFRKLGFIKDRNTWWLKLK
jgi:GNAT superfamily N-acetyltransferase